MDAADEIWNRAAMNGGGPDPSQGDAALVSVLGVHNMAMSGGLLNVGEQLSLDQLEGAWRDSASFGWTRLRT